MVHILRRGMLVEMGLSGEAITGALTCCLTRVRRDAYAVRVLCGDPSHSALRRFADDNSLLRISGKPGLRGDVAKLQLRISALRGSEPTGGVFSHTSAALIHDLPLVTVPGPFVEFIVRGRSRTRRDIRIRDRALPDDHVERRHGYPVTTLTRTLADVARDCGAVVAVPMIDHVLHRVRSARGEHGLSREPGGWSEPGMQSGGNALTEPRLRTEQDIRKAVLAAASVCARASDRRRIERLLSRADARRESPAESLCAVRFVEHGLVGFEPQVEIRDRSDAFLGRVDFLHRESRVIVEVEGLEKYTLDGRDRDESFQAERVREYRLRNQGYSVHHLTWKDLFRVTPFEEIGAAVAEGLRRAG
ncbi:hypothetical protein [Brevibacterium album]|uniref:hypothetical protein n=1 Tax=Brevibacterium album TaxID=417948 RepID=UPI0004269F77|nr:hypothetical protein [Brevibacterium album]